MPFAIESFNLEKYDLILSSSHCVAKSVKPVQEVFIFVIAILQCVIYGINLISIFVEVNLVYSLGNYEDIKAVVSAMGF